MSTVSKMPVYGGVVYPAGVALSDLERIPRELSLDRDVLVTGYPRCGSTWLLEITWLVFHEGDFTAAQQVPQAARIPFLEMSDVKTGRSRLDKLADIPHPRVVKSHLRADSFTSQLRHDDVRVIIPVRNPKDMLVSLYHYYRMNAVLGSFKGSWEDFFELFKEKKLAYGDYFDWYESWWRLDDPEVLFVRYEDMARDLRGQVVKIAGFLGKQLSDETVSRIVDHCTFSQMKDNKMVNYSHVPKRIVNQDISPFMRKGQVGDWKNYFTKDQSDYVDVLYERRQTGLWQDSYLSAQL